MLSKICIFALLLITSFCSVVRAQTRLSYGDTTGPFIDLATEHPISNSQGDSRVITGFAERFDLPPGTKTLDSVDFIIDSFGADTNIVDIVPVMTSQTSNGPELLPDFSNPNVIKIFHFSKGYLSGIRVSVSCGKVNVENSFFVFITNGLSAFGFYEAGNSYRTSEQTATFDLDTVRAAFVAIDTTIGLRPIIELVDGNLVPSGVNVDMDIGVTYEGSDGVQVHLSPSTSDAIAFPDPTPVGNPISVSGTGPFVSAEIVDDAGRIVRTLTEESGAPSKQLPTRGLSAGVYNAILFHSDGSTSSVKFVIQ